MKLAFWICRGISSLRGTFSDRLNAIERRGSQAVKSGPFARCIRDFPLCVALFSGRLHSNTLSARCHTFRAIGPFDGKWFRK